MSAVFYMCGLCFALMSCQAFSQKLGFAEDEVKYSYIVGVVSFYFSLTTRKTNQIDSDKVIVWHEPTNFEGKWGEKLRTFENECRQKGVTIYYKRMWVIYSLMFGYENSE